jgi:DNA-binding transcriptional LysR family regulator
MNQTPQTVNPLDSRQLNAFINIARTGSFAETAKRLCLTQSAISHSMHALESEIGCRLLARMGKTITLTEAGEALLHHAQVGFQELAAAREKIEKLKSWGSRRLRVGASPLVNRRILPGVLMKLRCQHPRLIVTVKTVHPLSQTDQLQNDELDFVFSEDQPPHAEVEFTSLFESPLEVVVPPAHRWLRQNQIPRGELFSEPCVLPERYSPTRKLIDAYFSREKKSFNSVMEVENLETIREMVKAGIGISILPAWVFQDDQRLGTLHAFALGRRKLSLAWGLHRSRNKPADLIQSDFRILCVATVKSLLSVPYSPAPASLGENEKSANTSPAG